MQQRKVAAPGLAQRPAAVRDVRCDHGRDGACRQQSEQLDGRGNPEGGRRPERRDDRTAEGQAQQLGAGGDQIEHRPAEHVAVAAEQSGDQRRLDRGRQRLPDRQQCHHRDGQQRWQLSDREQQGRDHPEGCADDQDRTDRQSVGQRGQEGAAEQLRQESGRERGARPQR
jgi:hypothetical protein